ncbi:BppU family phage baseplate upper protein [Staphylococcus hominis]|uniref:BppU family phage baseplate upper protein n=1 Tax=Staphylococcus hominis TaxID=1290 RepID=UPI0031BB316D
MSLMDKDGIYKNAKLIASDTPYLKPLSDEQIVFYNLDVNTAMLTFQLKKDEHPLQISSLNSDIDLYVESENGSRITLGVTEYVDSTNGIIRFVIDRDFLKAATNTWVKGQVRVKAVGRLDTVILNEFTFYVKDALINKIGADIKLRYIRQIDDLIEDTKKRLIAASAGIDNVEDIQLSFNSFISEQKQDLEKIVTDTERRTNNLVDSAQKDINSAIQNMRDEADTIRKNLNDETAGAVTKPDLDTTLSNYVTTVDFNNALNNKADKGEVAPSNLPENFNELINQAVSDRINELNQNKPLFNDNGEVYEINNPDLSTMDFVDTSGYFYAVGPLHTPDGNDTEGMLQILAYGNYTKVIYSPNESNEIYLRSKLDQVGNNWTDWLNIGSEVEIGTNDSYFEESYEDVDTSIDESDTDTTTIEDNTGTPVEGSEVSNPASENDTETTNNESNVDSSTDSTETT